MRRNTIAVLVLALNLAAAAGLRAQGLEYVKANYTKYEYLIPMRDGKRLFTAVYAPKDASRKYPILLSRTPYSVGPYGIDRYKPDLGPSPLFGREGYIVAYQDVRGRFLSEGEFVHMRPHKDRKDGPRDIDECTDTYDTIDWLIAHVEGNNGRVGMWGISYPGFYTAAGMIDAHPALKAASPQAPVTDWFAGDDWHHNGAFFLPHAFNFMAGFDHPRPKPTSRMPTRSEPASPDGYDFFLRLGPLSEANEKHLKGEAAFWHEMAKHDTYDEFWKSRNIRPHLRDIAPAVMTVGGWFDAENLFGALETYRNVEAHSPKGENTLVMGPWFHGGWSRDDGDHLGHVPFNSKTSAFYREKIEFPFFQRHLKGQSSPGGNLPEAYVFETGRNQWRTFDAWPPRDAKAGALFLRARGRLGFEPPDDEADADDTFDEYVSDPSKPVPFMDTIVNGMAREYMVADQRFASRRPDVLVYETAPLDEDVTVAGPIEADLLVSTSGTDSDWVVKLIDVYPADFPDPEPNPAGVRMGGYQQLVRGDVIRGRFRHALDKPEAFEPGEPTRVRFRLPDVLHTFRPGHRIMVHVQSTWFPLVDRNPQQLMNISDAKDSDYRKATQRVYRSRDKASRLRVLLLP
ncbi:MAG TPA: CocE/NonD family hydrolase [Isosphaeraceae bacterium]|nr:CocE/NonD family hydrolase [Isosphaeraceae bacterium]